MLRSQENPTVSETPKEVLDHAAFLDRFLTYGHWDFLSPDAFRLLPLKEFIVKLDTCKAAEHWLANLLSECSEEDVKIGILEDSLMQNHYHTLFFSEPDVFHRYTIEMEDLPVLTLENQMRTVLITSLPESLLELTPRRFWRYWVGPLLRKSNIQNDCSLVVDNGVIKMAQTSLGFLFRKLVMDFSEGAAQEYLRRGLNKMQHQALQYALGDDYVGKYEAFFLPFVESNQIENIKYLSEGANGTVWSAHWKVPHLQSDNPQEATRVALKQPKKPLGNPDQMDEFVKEVNGTFVLN